MAYLGRGLDKISNIEVLDNITFDGSSSYSITKGSVAFTPNSAQSCLISIDGVVQATNFTVSSSTIDFGVAIPSTSTCNFFLHYGTGVMTVPSDGSVTTAKLGDSAVTTAKINDGAITSAKINSSVGLGITMADQWRLTTNTSITTSYATLTAWEQSDTYGAGTIGSSMSVSSGIFTFPSTGTYLIHAQAYVSINNDQRYNTMKIAVTTDNSSYNEASAGSQFIKVAQSNYTIGNLNISYIFNVSDTSNRKVRFEIIGSAANGNFGGSTDQNITAVRFIRLGDST